jgi:cation diffusion facilitator CzcD-associated flavoprotein CzcO
MTRERSKPRNDLRFVIVGAGMAGIASAIKLAEAGFDDIVIYEKADRIGGTWRENTYPGIACDVPSHFYSYSFALNPEWSRRYAPGAEIREYFENVAHGYGVDSRIRFGKEIVRCEHVNGRWRLRASDGTQDEADFVIAATGVLHHPAYPEIEGLDSFDGPRFHSARWDHDVDLAGKRVGVIGTGSSAVQIVSSTVDRVKALTLFQRTPQWITPIENTPFTEEEKARFRVDPTAMLAIRAEVSSMYIDGFSNHLSDMDSPQLAMIHEFCKAHLENSVKEPVLREKLRPTYRAACKRLVLSDRFYDAIQRPNATLVTERIARGERGGVRTHDGELHELDVLVLATGFRVDRFLRPIEVIGRDGTSLEAAWQTGPAAYLALSVPDFPNLFMLNGPNGPVGNFSLIEVVELQLAYILRLVEEVRNGRCREISASHAAMQRFDTDRREAAKHTIWASGCRSWYLDADDLPTAWPWTYDRFREEMTEPRLTDYDMR